jgi:hypothetical protein
LQRQVVLRPLAADHPNFTGSNPNFNAAIGPWDVDNDGDGLPDSVWVDVGLPVQTAPDGRRYKPLAAILCLDMDGRLNVNAHGSIAQAEPNYTVPPAAPAANYYGGASVPTMTRGQGYGPPEINLGAGLGLNLGQFGQLLAARYGEAVSATSPYPGASQADDMQSALKQIEWPTTLTAGKPSAYGTAFDLWGRGFVALDVRGTPLTPYMGTVSDTMDDPYELDLSRKATRTVSSSTSGSGLSDSPFTPAELERLLRMYDIDASALPDRLRTLLAPSTLGANVRGMVTTESYDLPVPSILPKTQVLATLQQYGYPVVNVGLSEMLLAKVLKGYTPPLTPAQKATIENLAKTLRRQLLPPELVAGLRFDLNRPFGNGQDDNGNGVVDEPAEAASGVEPAWLAQPNAAQRPTVPAAFQTQTVPSSQPPYFTPSNGIDVNGDNNYDNTTDAMLARQLYARHLYVLMMLLKDDSIDIDFDGDGTSSPAETARGIAQWAINVVDFRDRDSIMTPFEYDPNPFNGWLVDGDITTTGEPERGVVWGCERPELLITETLAFHDRRTEDLDPPSKKTTDIPPDPDFDQRLVPLGSLFVELYNPWTTHTSSTNATGYPDVTEVPGEFYDVKNNGTTPISGVVLDSRVPDGSGKTDRNSTGAPVWRLMIQTGAIDPATRERKDPDDATNPPPPTDLERCAYFVDVTNMATPPTFPGVSYYSTIPVDRVVPGRYAVVGSAGFIDPSDPTAYVTPIGRPKSWTTEGTNYAPYRRIVLKPTKGIGTNQVEIYQNNGGGGTTEPAPIGQPSAGANGAQPVIAAVINHAVGEAYPRSMSISEPTGGYPAATGTLGSEPYYSPTQDHPLDEPLGTPANPVLSGVGNGTKSNFRTIHLQRLANPLLPWDPTTNPYLTVDSMSVDLTVFNGVDKSGNPQKPAEPGPSNGVLASLQRGEYEGATTPNNNNLWRHESPRPAKAPLPGTAVNQIYPYYVQTTLGYLNMFAPPLTPKRSNDNGNAYTSATAPAPRYAGAPNVKPFPWLAWNDRPFIGPLELMLVPKSRSSRLLYEFNPVCSSLSTSPNPPPLAAGFKDTSGTPGGQPGGHLLDFLQTTVPGTGPAATHFYRLFDYVQVPSRFVGTETELNPSSSFFGKDISTCLPAAMQAEDSLMAHFHQHDS